MNTTDEILVQSFAAQPANLRIAIVTETFPPEVNGVAMTLGRIVDGLLLRGHAVQVVRPRQLREKQDLSGGVRDGLDQVLSKGMPLPSYGELRFGLPAKKRLMRLWTDKRPDVVHVVTEGPLGWSAVAAARALQLPVTSSFHTNFESYSQHYGIGLLKTPIDSYLRKLHNRTLATMVPTRAMQQSLLARGYKNVTLLSRGVDTQLFNPSKRSSPLRARWGVCANGLAVLHVGRLAKEKNVGVLVAAFRAVQQRVPYAKLVLVGDGPLRESLQAMCPDAVFAGVQKGEDLAAHYASGDVFLFPSETETFGNVVPEALASGLALVAYAKAAAAELVTPSHDGVLVTPGDDVAFVKAALEVCVDASLQMRLRAAAPHSVAHLGWDAIHDSFIATLVRAVDGHGHRFVPAANSYPTVAALSPPTA